MIEIILSMIVSCIRACNDWFITILGATGTVSLVVGFVSITLAARFILRPIVGGAFFRAASDRVKKSSIGEKE